MDRLAENINSIKQRIRNIAIKSERKPEDIHLVAVTKNVDTKTVMRLLELGINNIGENRVQELLKKYNELNESKIIDVSANSPVWHFIGHLQTNKVKYIVDKVDLIHSVDSYKLAQVINENCEKINRPIDVLVQVNISNEESKHGVKAGELDKLINQISQLSYVKVKGLMTIAPYTDNPETVRPIFRKLNELFIDIKEKKYDNINMLYLSAGMTNDYDIAIEEGANIVRIGTGIFKDYSTG